MSSAAPATPARAYTASEPARSEPEGPGGRARTRTGTPERHTPVIRSGPRQHVRHGPSRSSSSPQGPTSGPSGQGPRDLRSVNLPALRYSPDRCSRVPPLAVGGYRDGWIRLDGCHRCTRNLGVRNRTYGSAPGVWTALWEVCHGAEPPLPPGRGRPLDHRDCWARRKRGDCGPGPREVIAYQQKHGAGMTLLTGELARRARPAVRAPGTSLNCALVPTGARWSWPAWSSPCRNGWCSRGTGSTGGTGGSRGSGGPGGLFSRHGMPPGPAGGPAHTPPPPRKPLRTVGPPG